MNIKTNFIKVSLGALLAVSTQMIAVTAQADILSIGTHAKVLTKANTPKHGQTMQVVSSKFGKAQRVSVSKGAVTKHNPKITRWDYKGFSVFFENSHVIHSVIHSVIHR